MPFGREVGFGPGHIVLDGDPAPTPPKGHSPPIFGPCLLWTQPLPPKGRSPSQFSAHVYCGQTAAWIKMPLGTEVDLGLRDIAFDVDPATPIKRAYHSHPIFGPYLLWPNGWMDEDAAWYGSRPRPRPHCTRRGSQHPRKGHSSPPIFGPCLLWQQLPISGSAELLLI